FPAHWPSIAGSPPTGPDRGHPQRDRFAIVARPQHRPSRLEEREEGAGASAAAVSIAARIFHGLGMDKSYGFRLTLHKKYVTNSDSLAKGAPSMSRMFADTGSNPATVEELQRLIRLVMPPSPADAGSGERQGRPPELDI